ncbi:hypothetical protein MMC07_002898 [Pseudocyphellaria aurata]|nr:hypothetical protein [Pseudocyphellaria aurata]
MDSQYPHGPAYAPSQPPDNRRSSLSSQGACAASQTLPPLSTHTYILPYHQNECIHQTPLVPRNQAPTSQAGNYTSYSYIPHGLPQYNGSNSTYTQSQRSFPSSPAYSSPTSNAPAYLYSSSVSTSGRLPDLRPMPAGGLNDQSSLSSVNTQSSTPSLRLQNGQESQPTHVVGSQGRRGILPSAVGRPAAVTAGNAAGPKAANVPAKDADGKFPCAHCAKTYLHAKHLKRHLLRHTGTRPYSCGLCRDTFSRSDILKRHFQKCSVRRGNPTGENHLSHSRATKKSKLEAAAEAPVTDRVHVPPPSTQPTVTTDFATGNLNGAFDLSTLVLGPSGYSDENQPLSNRESPSSSVKRPSNSSLTRNRSTYGSSSSSGYDTAGFAYSGGQITPDSITTSGAATPFPYPQEARPNQFSSDSSFNLNNRASTGSNYASGSLPQILESSPGRVSDVDWSSLFQSNTHDDYGNTQFHHSLESSHHSVKSEPEFSNGPFPLQPGYTPYLPTKV